MFRQPLRWSSSYSWMSFIPLSPSFISLPFEPLCWMPWIMESTIDVEVNGDFQPEKCFTMKIEDMFVWMRIEEKISSAADNLCTCTDFGIPGSPPSSKQVQLYGWSQIQCHREENDHLVSRLVYDLDGLPTYLMLWYRQKYVLIPESWTWITLCWFGTGTCYSQLFGGLAEWPLILICLLVYIVNKTLDAALSSTWRVTIKTPLHLDSLLLVGYLHLWFVWTKWAEQEICCYPVLHYLQTPDELLERALKLISSTPSNTITVCRTSTARQ